MATRLGVLAVSALGLQLLVIFAGLGELTDVRRGLFVFSYLLLIVFVLANLRRPGIAVIGVGLALNFLAIVSNGGLMPVTPEALDRVGPPPTEIELGEPVPLTKDVLLAREDTRLWPLTDILTWENPTNIQLFSVGDLFIAAGLALTLAELLLPRLRRVPPDNPSLA
jgi:hypothetical protein